MSRPMKITVILMATILVMLFFALDLNEFFTLATLKAKQAEFAHIYAEHTLATLALYFLLYMTMAALSLPGAAIVI